ncbi:MAG: hypothetical protein PUB69_04470 [Desulfovibrionaceae bacterium]|nr:hypothetical protein [Desulfovibrionaceae bacterium]
MQLSWEEIQARAITFSKKWETAHREEAEVQSFLRDFFKVFGIDDLISFGVFEYKVPLDDNHNGYIDYLFPQKIAVEMKSSKKDLKKAFEQLQNYVIHLKADEIPSLLMVCDFENIILYKRTSGEKVSFKTKDLRKYIRHFADIAGYETTRTYEKQQGVNVKAASKMAALHNAMESIGYEGHSLEVYLVRLLFCLFADDTGIFPKGSFQSYVENSNEDGSNLSARLERLFEVLNMPVDVRKKKSLLKQDLLQFQYINGGLFAEKLDFADFDAKMRATLLESCSFDWNNISPAIFGSMFQGVMNKKERHDLGAHYTSEENILKVINPLFMDDLYAEFERVKASPLQLEQFHTKLASLKFLDPACGCGNFLIIAYRELRKLELEVLKMKIGTRQRVIDISPYVKVNVGQFYGIEIEEFPCQVAQVGMWLIDHQMNMKVSEQFGQYFARLPLKQSASIVNANALRIDWNDVVPSSELSYIFGNPPFLGRRYRTEEQIKEVAQYFEYKDIDYVCCWFKKAYHFMLQNKAIKTCFVATNSISQGEQVQALWNELNNNGIIINYAYKTFKWSNEAKEKAAVHCVIIGYSFYNNINKTIYDEIGNANTATNINGYLIDAPDVYINIRSKPICDVPQMKNGNVPLDGDALKIECEDIDKFGDFKYIKRLIGGRELLHNEKRYVLWLVDASPSEIKANKEVLRRVELCRKNRLSMKDKGTQKLADRPTTFRDTNNPEFYIALPMVSSERRTYLPMCYFDKDTIPTNQIQIIANASHYHFGVLSSIVHMAWMKVIAGRLEMRYRYSKDIVYNNFPWPENVTDEQRTNVETLSEQILDIRNRYADRSLADLYDPLFTPSDLLKAHKKLDVAVLSLYGLPSNITEPKIVADLLNRYEKLIEQEKLAQPEKPKRMRKKN